MKIVEDFQLEKYRVLILDGNRFSAKHYRKYKIDGKEYESVPVYDAGDNVVAIEAEGSFAGKTIEFI